MVLLLLHVRWEALTLRRRPSSVLLRWTYECMCVSVCALSLLRCSIELTTVHVLTEDEAGTRARARCASAPR